MNAELFVTKNVNRLSIERIKSEADIYSMEGSVGLVLGNSDVYMISKNCTNFLRRIRHCNFLERF